MWLNELSCLPILLGVSLLLNSSLWARPKPVVSACFPIPSRERPLPPELPSLLMSRPPTLRSRYTCDFLFVLAGMTRLSVRQHHMR